VRVRSAVHVALVGAAVPLLAGGLALSRGAAGPFDALGGLALGLAIIVAAALLGGHLASHIGQPAVLGELLAGMLLGNLPGLARLQFLGADPFIDILSRVGMLLLLFEVGLDLSVRDLYEVGLSSLLVALIGTASSLAIGTATAAMFMPGTPIATRVFLGAAITATSVGITARVLKDMGASRSGEARIILGAAVVDDVLALVVLGAVTAWVGEGPAGTVFPVTSIVALVMKTTGFLVLALVLGTRLTPAWFRHAARLRTGGALLAVGLCFCFFLSWAASAIGLAALVGAFAAGLVLEDTHSETFVQRGERPLGQLLQPMTSFLVPVFFVLVGFRTNIVALGHPAVLAFAVALSIAAVLGKTACVVGVVNRGVRKLTVAAGMIPRGEVTLVFAALGSTLQFGQAPLLDERGYTAIVTVVIVTTLVTPPALKWSMRVTKGSPGVTRPAA
jgi:Kef-type K+ transport system membrane component KefB